MFFCICDIIYDKFPTIEQIDNKKLPNSGTGYLYSIKHKTNIVHFNYGFMFQIIVYTLFYISNADFYIALNHIKIIYNSFLFFVFYSLEHIFLVFHKHL